MTQEGRLKRGKANYEAGKFLDNPETIEYINSISKESKDVTKSKKDK